MSFSVKQMSQKMHRGGSLREQVDIDYRTLIKL
jgi:hypothetical protein